jgi:hypothetical protein
MYVDVCSEEHLNAVALVLRQNDITAVKNRIATISATALPKGFEPKENLKTQQMLDRLRSTLAGLQVEHARLTRLGR